MPKPDQFFWLWQPAQPFQLLWIREKVNRGEEVNPEVHLTAKIALFTHGPEFMGCILAPILYWEGAAFVEAIKNLLILDRVRKREQL